MITSTVGVWPGRALRVGADESAALVTDWQALARTGDSTKLEGITHNPSTPARPYDKPLIAAHYDDDKVAPLAAVEALCARLPAANTTVTSLGAGGHLGWLRRPQRPIELLSRQLWPTPSAPAH
ncbi:hypothetical protein [Gordonia shandongensis]|uniref:hypothetical protein n=1 Tax=Gordonia shandongensis TaxID=376351 RepID=UPI0012EC31E5|nr:hypothetical protein [Gordonia shandongensis]